MKTLRSLIAGTFILPLAAVAFAQAPGGDGAASAPAATAPVAPPHKAVAPAGFKVLTINGRRAMCEAADEPWVTTALTKIVATTKPATQPATILQRLSDNRESIIRQMMVDLATNDPVPLAKGYDTDLSAAVRALDELRPPTYYLISTPERLTAAMKGGWEDPRFYYNRAADSVSFNASGALATDRPMDDVVFPVIYDPKDPADKRGESLTVQVAGTEAQIAAAIDTRARIVVNNGFAQLVNNVAFEPLKLREDQMWLSIGVASILGSKYTAIILDMPRQQLVQQLVFEHPQNPLKMSVVDLLHPTDLKTMRPEAVPAYFDTVHRKSSRAVQYLIEKGGGDGAVPKAVAALRDKKPADGPALVKAIQDATSVDLTPALGRS